MSNPNDYTQWCRNLFTSLNEGGRWSVPRSGMVFTKRGEKLVLTDLLPYQLEMPITEQELVEYQDSEFQETKEQFALAGITVEREVPSGTID